MKSAGIFVDCVNQYFGIGSAYKGYKLSYAKYLKKALEIAQGDLLRAFAYGVQLQNEATPFITALIAAGYEPRYRQARIFGGVKCESCGMYGAEKADIRKTTNYLNMFADVIRLIDRMDVAVIGSSDLEIIPMVDCIRERGVKVIILSYGIPEELMAHCDFYCNITEDMLEKPKELVQQ